MENEITNKVAQANIEQIDLTSFLPTSPVLALDVKELLWQELVLREKPFRAWIKTHDWGAYDDKVVAVFCSNEAIVPAWAFMLISAQLHQATTVVYGTVDQAREQLFFDRLNQWPTDHLRDKRVMVKGCADIPNPNNAYVVLTKKLTPIVKSLMFGEPCSAVPIFKRR